MYHLLHTNRMYDYLYMNTTDRLVLQIVKDNDGVNCEFVSKHFEVGPTHIQSILKKFHIKGMIYISAYKPDKRNCMRPLYSYGSGEDAVKPPVKYATERKQERMLAARAPFTPHRDIAAEWMTHL